MHAAARGNELRPWFLFLFLEQSKERDTGDLNYLKADPWNITYCMTRAPKPCNKYFVVFIDIIQTTVARDERSYLLPILNQLDAHAFTDS